MLCLFADPLRGSKIRIDRESRTLQEIEDHGGIDVRIRHAVRVTDIIGLLLREKPQILHFGGHGSRDGELVFENDPDADAKVRPASDLVQGAKVGPASLARAIAATTAAPLDCVVLNSCFTGANADAFRDVTKVVVGSATALPDDTALAFVRGFYTGISRGQEVAKAFEAGRAQLGLVGSDASSLHLVSFAEPLRERR